MPVFLGSFVGKKDKSRIIELTQSFHQLINNETNNEITKVFSDYWTICVALKEHESNQEKIITLPDNQGIAIGRYYNNNDSSQISFDYKSIAKTSGKWLSENYWGRYILILADSNDINISIYQDTIGLSKVFFFKHKDDIFFSSDIQLLYAILMQNKIVQNIDWQYFSSYLYFGSLNTSRTPFRNIIELLPGCRLHYRENDYKITFYYNFTSNQVRQDFDNALVFAMQKSTAQLIEKSSTVCLQLSGGLDSSALYLTLKNIIDKDQKCILVNYKNSLISSSDESEYVKKIVTDSNMKLIFHQQDYSVNLHKKKSWNRPDPSMFEINSKLELLDKINEKEVTFISGHGGDHLFLSSVDPSFLADSLLNENLAVFYNKIKEASIIKRSPMFPLLFSSLKSLFRYLFKMGPEKTVYQQKPFLSVDLQELVECEIYRPAFYNNLFNISPGKIFHILQAYYATTVPGMGGFGLSEEIYPYLSQPIFELALSVPTYKTFNAKWTRLHFRTAIAKHFNSPHVWRQSKGEISGIIQSFIRNDFNRIKALCLEGQFSKQNLINKHLMHKQLNLMANGYLVDLWPILRLLSAELWFEGWAI